MRVSETAHWLEWQDWANPILQHPYEVKNGKLHIPDVPGGRAGVGREGGSRSPSRRLLVPEPSISEGGAPGEQGKSSRLKA